MNQTFDATGEGSLAYGERAIEYIADLPCILGVRYPSSDVRPVNLGVGVMLDGFKVNWILFDAGGSPLMSCARQPNVLGEIFKGLIPI